MARFLAAQPFHQALVETVGVGFGRLVALAAGRMGQSAPRCRCCTSRDQHLVVIAVRRLLMAGRRAVQSEQSGNLMAQRTGALVVVRRREMKRRA